MSEGFVKSIYTFLALLGIVFASHAQQTASENTEGKNVDKSRPQRVASPNRTSSRDWASSHKSNKSDKYDGGKDASNRAPIVWVDSTGATVGRALDSGTVLVKVENEIAALTGLITDVNCDLNSACTFSGGRRFSRTFEVVFTSADCTGAPLVPISRPSGARYDGIPIFDGGETFIYIFNVAQSPFLNIQSTFTNGSCFTTLSAGNFSPVIAVIPVSTFGIQPFFLK
jgi:hypothetical protein